MLDYHGDRIALAEFVAVLSGASFPEPEISDVQARHVAAVGAEPGAALLGSFVHHLLVHGGDGGEVAEPGSQTGTELGLGPLEQRRFGLLVEVEDELPPNGSAPLQAVLLDRSERERVAGSLGVVLIAPAR